MKEITTARFETCGHVASFPAGRMGADICGDCLAAHVARFDAVFKIESTAAFNARICGSTEILRCQVPRD
jgi:hypothetical protein